MATASDDRGDSFVRKIVPNHERGQLLLKAPVFAKLDEVERDKLGGVTSEMSFAAGAVVYKEGDDIDNFYIVMSGCFEVKKYDAEKKTQVVISKFTTGDHFGEQSIMAHSKRLFTVTALTPSACLTLSEKEFMILFRQDRINVKFAARDVEVCNYGRGAISAEATDINQYTGSMQFEGKTFDQIVAVKLDDANQTFLLDVINKSLLFKSLAEEHKVLCAKSMKCVDIRKGDTVINEGDEGNTFYIVEQGEFDVFQKNSSGGQVKVDHHGRGGSFGELALMYDAPRNATVTAVSNAKVRVLQRAWLNRIAMAAGQEKLNKVSAWLAKIELLAPLSSVERGSIAEAMEVLDFPQPATVFKQGDEGDALYIVVKGRAIFYQTDNDIKEKKMDKEIGPGEFFGERALMSNQPRSATAKVIENTQLLKVTRKVVETLMGPVSDILMSKTQNYEREEGWKPAGIPFSSFRLVGVLGKGSYGSVKLVRSTVTDKTYALKAVSKQRIVETRQKEHVFNEKNLMCAMNHPFLIKLYQTYKDADRLYFLLEPALGGELFPILRRYGGFPPFQAKFYTAQILLCFEYMHSIDYVYRDLKPENLLLDDMGYLKITDFGFCKHVPDRTWTMCGTPEYMAPEIIQRFSHGKGVDWWTLGILLFEMLSGFSPFWRKGQDNMKMYERIISGVYHVPSHVHEPEKELIAGLLQVKPTNRLGVIKGGATTIKSQKWFEGFDFTALLWKKMEAPMKVKVGDGYDVSNFKQNISEMRVKQYQNDGTDWEADF